MRLRQTGNRERPASEIRAIVGGKDFPEMVRNVAALAEAEVVRHKAVEACVKKFCKKDDKN